MSVWLVTGCSSGVGEAFVREAVARGDKVIATGRNAATKLAHLKGQGVAILDLDVTAPQEEINAKLKEAISIYGHIDILVNNAGFISIAFMEDSGKEDWMSVLNTNFFGATNVTRALLPHFRSRKAGKIAFINSIYAHFADPCAGPYAISKHALAGYVTTLRKEVSQFNIQTIDFYLGHFRTTVVSPSKTQVKFCPISDYQPMFQKLVESTPQMDGLQPGDVEKGTKVMVDVLKGDGAAKGRKMPERMPIGADAVDQLRAHHQEFLQICDEWESMARNTDRDGPKEGAWAMGGDYVH